MKRFVFTMLAALAACHIFTGCATIKKWRGTWENPDCAPPCKPCNHCAKCQ
jgi:hypothetical protein